MRPVVGAAITALLLASAAAAATPTITEYGAGITKSSNPFGIAKGPDGNLWFTEYRDRIGKITPAGAVTEYAVSGGPRLIAAGPDGNLWFTEYDGDRIGRVTPAGAVTEFGSGIYPGARLTGIAAGPDGNVWFTELSRSRIGKITPEGAVTEYRLDNGRYPFAITAGPDGNLWFTEAVGDKIGKMTPSGTYTEYDIASGSNAQGIVAGADGNLWFVEYGRDAIGKITTGGAVTEYRAGISPGSGPRGIAAGPDGNIWFSEYDGNRIARITPGGAVTEYGAGISAGAGPRGIVAGPDGNIWFTEYNGDRIGRLTLDTTPPVLSLPAGRKAEAEGPSGAVVTWSASASDPDDQAGPVECSPPSGSTFPLGSTLVTCSSTDTQGNKGTGSFTVTVVDTTPPELRLPKRPVRVTTANRKGRRLGLRPVARDIVDGSVAETCTPALSRLFRLGKTTVRCSARDRAGNRASGHFDVVVSLKRTKKH